MKYSLFRVVLETPYANGEHVEYEYGEDGLEALELVLGRLGYTVRVTQCKKADNSDLLEAARVKSG